MGIFSARWFLHMKAAIWRALMAVGMKFHKFAEPRPPHPNFKIVIPSRLSPRGGTFKLVFYVPDSYLTTPDAYRFPVVVNFHGGGFTLGTGTDDARWASTVVNLVDAVFVSVEYRLAPEYPFSVGVEDGTDALIYLASHAEELCLDPHRIALSGFSAGGNFAFTVPLMLHDLQIDAGKRSLREPSPVRPSSRHSTRPSSSHLRTHLGPSTSAFSSTLSLPRPKLEQAMSSTSVLKLSDLEPTALEIAQEVPDLTIKAIISFYPPTDFRSSRKEKRATNPAPEKNLPPMLTNLFDESYMHPHSLVDMNDPYLSPMAASDAQLRASLPDEIILYTCEYDMLNVEGKAFGERLKSDAVGKTVHGGEVKAVPHAFDKKPNPVKFPKAADRIYSEACAELKRVFGGRVSFEERTQLELSKAVERFDGDALRDEGGEEEEGPLIGEGGTTRGERERERERRWREAPGITIDGPPPETNGVR
ncbi:alpha/beta-hydrolase [Hyaloscypha variabilis F]|uniref:Alpha/beta-hydrolase n=1 Tax=Hyaloscypha variabilis (strain UAMH 11265 / GT02V1 / F) TaxID=1149755 RepID=A0A2J6RRU8_HYAVF|nr:alpha/beta-hydrolase [Hyaloscypha variabilis F]